MQKKKKKKKSAKNIFSSTARHNKSSTYDFVKLINYALNNCAQMFSTYSVAS